MERGSTLQLQGQRIRRCPGIELESVLHSSGQLGAGAGVFYGGAPGLAEAAATAAAANTFFECSRHPARLHSPQKKKNCDKLSRNSTPGDFLWARGATPSCGLLKTVFFVPRLPGLVGGSFDVWAGVKSRAPAWLADNHLEWLYRLYQEPWRWRQILATVCLESFGSSVDEYVS